MVYLLWLFAFLAFISFGLNTVLKNGHRMAHSAIMMAIWAALALWWGGAFG